MIGGVRSRAVPSGTNVLLLPRPELDCTDVLVLRRTGDGGRSAFTRDHGWQLVAAGAEAHVYDRIVGAPAVDLHLLFEVLVEIRERLRLEAL